MAGNISASLSLQVGRAKRAAAGISNVPAAASPADSAASPESVSPLHQDLISPDPCRSKRLRQGMTESCLPLHKKKLSGSGQGSLESPAWFLRRMADARQLHVTIKSFQITQGNVVCRSLPLGLQEKVSRRKHEEKHKRRKTAGTIRGLQIVILLQHTYENGLLRRLQPRPQGKMQRRNTKRSTRRRPRAQLRLLQLQLALTGHRMMWVAATRTTQLPPQLPSAAAQRLPSPPRCEPVLVSETGCLRRLRISAAGRYLTCLPACL